MRNRINKYRRVRLELSEDTKLWLLILGLFLVLPFLTTVLMLFFFL